MKKFFFISTIILSVNISFAKSFYEVHMEGILKINNINLSAEEIIDFTGISNLDLDLESLSCSSSSVEYDIFFNQLISNQKLKLAELLIFSSPSELGNLKSLSELNFNIAGYTLISMYQFCDHRNRTNLRNVQ